MRTGTRQLLRAAAALAFGTFATSCGDSFGPEDVAGMYVLQRVGADALPATVTRETRALEILADTLWLERDGKARVVQVHVFHSPGMPEELQRWEWRIETTIRDGAIEYVDPCRGDPLASCAAPPFTRATRQDGTLVATPHETDFSPEKPRVYRLVNR